LPGNGRYSVTIIDISGQSANKNMALSDNIWWTRKARIQTEKRLLSNAFQSQILVLWYSFCSVAASVYYLKFNTHSEYSGIVWVVFSVLVLGISGFITGLSIKERAALVKEYYETLNDLYQEAKANLSDQKIIAEDYKKVLSVCENHTDRDYYVALCEAYLTHENPNDPQNGIDRKPTLYVWLLVLAYKLRRFMLFGCLYVLPVILFWMVEFLSVCKTAV
jgi:hypothetical protein